MAIESYQTKFLPFLLFIYIVLKFINIIVYFSISIIKIVAFLTRNFQFLVSYYLRKACRRQSH